MSAKFGTCTQVSHQNPGVILLSSSEEEGAPVSNSPEVTLIFPEQPPPPPGVMDNLSHSAHTIPESSFLPLGCGESADYCEENEVADYPDPALLRKLIK
jgi:hypothetical protein